jgi:hypothetical protein
VCWGGVPQKVRLGVFVSTSLGLGCREVLQCLRLVERGSLPVTSQKRNTKGAAESACRRLNWLSGVQVSGSDGIEIKEAGAKLARNDT